jgi:hypothetical protein
MIFGQEGGSMRGKGEEKGRWEMEMGNRDGKWRWEMERGNRDEK